MVSSAEADRRYADAMEARKTRQPTGDQLRAAEGLMANRNQDEVFPFRVDPASLRPEVVQAVLHPDEVVSHEELRTIAYLANLPPGDREHLHRFAALLRALAPNRRQTYTDVGDDPRCSLCWGRTTYDLIDYDAVDDDEPWASPPNVTTIPCPACQEKQITTTIPMSDIDWICREDPRSFEEIMKLPRGILDLVEGQLWKQIRNTPVVVTMPESIWEAWSEWIADAVSEYRASQW